jgi:hypothetical protein
MWLLTTVSQSAWLVFSPEPGAPPVFRFRQPYGSWACGSQHPPPPPSNLYSVDSGPPHIIDQSASLFFFVLYWILLPTGTALGLHSLKGRDNLQLSPQQPTQHFISPTFASRGKASAIRPPSPSVWPPCVISILSKSPKIVSCFYPALCSSNAYRGFKTAWSMAISSYFIYATKNVSPSHSLKCNSFYVKWGYRNVGHQHLTSDWTLYLYSLENIFKI